MRVCVALFFLFFAAGLVGASAETVPTAAELRARVDAALGPDPDNLRETIVSTGSLGPTTTIRFQNGKDVRRTFERGGIHSESGTYHGEHWLQNENGLTVIANAADGNEADEKITTSVAHVAKPFDAYVLERVNIRHAGSRTFIDPATNRVLRVERFGPTGTSVETIEDYSAFGSVTRAKHWSVTSLENKVDQHYERVEYQAGATVDADLAEPPTRRRLIDFPAGATGADLPVEFPGHQIVVHVTIGTRKVDFALDTGASGIYIDTSLASDLHLPLINTSTQFVAGRFTAHETIVPEIVAGKIRMHDIVANVVPVDFRENGNIKVQGLLGFDFLAQLGVTIDYEHRIVHVEPAEDYVPPADSATRAITVRLGSRVPMTTVRVGDAVAEHILFDTGWGAGNLAFFDYFARRYPSTFKTNLGRMPMQGVGGAFYAVVYQFPSINVGSLTFRNFVGTLVPAGMFAFDGDGVIGDGLISLFTVGLDYTNGQIYLTPNAAGTSDMRRAK